MMPHRKIAAMLVLLATTALPFASSDGSPCEVERKRFQPTGETTPEQMREFCTAAAKAGQNTEGCTGWTLPYTSGVLPELTAAGGDTVNVENCRQPEPRGSECRKAWQWPCAADSFFNIPIGSGAQFSDKSDPRVASLLGKGKVNLNTIGWSTAVYKAEASDPELTFSPSGIKFKGPFEMKPAMRELSAGDGQVNIVQPDDNTNYETEFTKIPSAGDTTIFHDKMLKVNKLRTSQCVGTKMGDYTGRWVYGGTSIAGLIRQWEMEGKNEVRHALNLGVCWEQLKNGPVWPATCQDGGCMKDNAKYTGAINMGTVFAIPPSVDIESLGLNQYSKKIAYAAQRYGIVVVAQACGPAMYAEQTLDESIASSIRGDLFKILQQLVVLTNVSQAAPKGGGSTSIPPAPPFCAPGGGDAEDPDEKGGGGTCEAIRKVIPGRSVLHPEGITGTSNRGGVIEKIPIPPADEYYLDYTLTFREGFDWELDGRGHRGGKLPGLGGGDGTGGCKPINPRDWSARQMWHEAGTAAAYLYHQDRKSGCGDNFAYTNSDGSEFHFEQGKTHRITQRVKVNTPNENDGELQIWVDGKEVVNKRDVRWRGDVDPSEGRVSVIMYASFFGGKGESWVPANDSYIDYGPMYLMSAAPDFSQPPGGCDDQPTPEPREVDDLDRLLKKCEGLDEKEMVACVLRIAEDWQ